jgi:hypothetical protein
MSVNVIAELHPIKRTRVKITTGSKPISEIIKNLNTGFPISQARVCRNGEIVKDFSIAAKDGDNLSIKFVPYGGPSEVGVGMKIGGWALAIAGGILIATGYGAGIGAALIGAGVGMLSGGTALLNINIPKAGDTEKPENDPSIRGGKNQARPLGRIPVLFGRHRLYPDLAANPYTSIIGNQQYFTQLFCGGYKDCVIDLNSFKLGENKLTDLADTEYIATILAGTNPYIWLEILQNGETSSLYPHCVHEDAVNAPLQNKIDGADGKKISGELVRSTPDKTDTINVDIFFYNGLGKYNDKNELKSTDVEVRASYKPFGADDSAYTLLGYFNNGSNTIAGAELKTKRYQITKSGLTPGQYTVKVERITADSTDSKIVDQVYVGSIRSIKSKDKNGNVIRPIRAERQKNLTIIALRVLATGQMNGIIDSFNYIATSKLPVYSGGGSGALYWLLSAETSNPASALLYALQSRAAQESVKNDDIDWPSLERFYEWCEQKDENGVCKYTCNAYLSEAVTIAELLRMIGSTARADILRIDSKISVVQDIERYAPMQLFTPKNTKNYSVAMFSADIPDEIALRFINEGSGYAQNEVSVYNTPDGNPPAGKPTETIQKVDLWGITNSAQVRRIGMYDFACLKNRPFVHTIEVDIEYLMCNKGDWIQYAGDIALTGSVHGRITEMLWSQSTGRYVGIRVDEPVETEPGKNYSVRVRLKDGTVFLKDVAIVNAPDEIYFTEPFSADYAPSRGDVYAFGIRGKEVLDLIITDIQPQADLSATLTCAEYSPEIFGVDRPDFRLPEFENKITPVSGAVDSGVVTTARWRLFITYHDSKWEPQRPQGDGQSNGWHYAHTSQALWQSSKSAESIDSGEWGQPVRIKGERGNTDVMPIYLSLSPQTVIIDCDTGGNILTDLLPFTSHADLYKWNYKIPIVEGITHYPGINEDLFDPMLGDFLPVEDQIFFSLDNAPHGVTISQAGVITIAEDAALEDEHSVTVKAEYQGETYTSILFIQVKKRIGDDLYLGTVDTIPAGPYVFILKGKDMGRVRALQGHYVLAIAEGTGAEFTWKAGWVYQWTGLTWEGRDPERYPYLYISCFKDGLDVPELKQDIGWFGGVMAGLLCAQKGFIEKLESLVIKLNAGGVLYGGDKYLENGNENPQSPAGAKGFWLGANGEAKLENATVSGNIIAKSGTFRGNVYANDGEFTGVIHAKSGDFSGNIIAGSIVASDINISGHITAGKNRLVRRNNMPYRFSADSTVGLELVVKDLVIAATGSITVRVRFSSVQGGAGYKIIRDGTQVASSTNIAVNTDIDHVVQLPNNINRIDLVLMVPSVSTGSTGNIINTKFELRSDQDPKFLQLLG